MLKERAHLMAADSSGSKIDFGSRRGACHQHQWPEIVLSKICCDATNCDASKAASICLNHMAPLQKGA